SAGSRLLPAAALGVSWEGPQPNEAEALASIERHQTIASQDRDRPSYVLRRHADANGEGGWRGGSEPMATGTCQSVEPLRAMARDCWTVLAVAGDLVSPPLHPIRLSLRHRSLRPLHRDAELLRLQTGAADLDPELQRFRHVERQRRAAVRGRRRV